MVQGRHLFCDEIMNPERQSIIEGINQDMQYTIADMYNTIKDNGAEILDLSLISMKSIPIEWPGALDSCEKTFVKLNIEFLPSKDAKRQSSVVEFLWSEGSLFLTDGG